MAPSEARRHIKRILNMVEGIEDKVYEVKVVEDFDEFFNWAKLLVPFRHYDK